MEEQHRLTVCTNFRFVVSENSRTLGNQMVTGSGKGVALVHIDKDYKTLWETRLSGGNTVYDGNRHLLEDGRWLFVFNEQDTSSEKWYTRVSVIDPESGSSELWLQVEIASRGTGLLPRISPVAGGLAVGNSEGYGWFTTAELATPEKDD